MDTETDLTIPYPPSTDTPADFLTAFSTPLPASGPAQSPSVMPDIPLVFANESDLGGILSHVSSPELAAATFIEPLEVLSASAPITPAANSFINDFTLSNPIYALPPLPQNTMDVVAPDPTLSQQTQAPSAAIHGAAAAYGAGVTSSLQSALEPALLHGGRSRANTLSSAVPLQPTAPVSLTPELQSLSVQNSFASPCQPMPIKSEEAALESIDGFFRG